MAKGRKTATAIERTDRKVAEAMLPRRRTLPVRLLDHVADLGDQPQMRLLCGALIAAGLVRGDRRLAGTGLRMLAAHTLATVAKDFIKRRIDRTRPRSKGRKGADGGISPGRSEAKEETSFPSGHSAGAAAVARAFARAYPDRAAPAYAAAGTIALAQIPRCAHYPTDVGAGLAIGLAAEALTEAAFGLLTPPAEAAIGRTPDALAPPSKESVIPAEAGISGPEVTARLAEIPASAGMTGAGGHRDLWSTPSGPGPDSLALPGASD
jgi:hypothetical protein